jgi:hypothetical protein
MTITLDILSLKGSDKVTNYIKQSDLEILKTGLEFKKVKINIITDISDLSFKNPIYVHDFSGCFIDHKLFKMFMRKFYVAYQKFQSDADTKKIVVKKNITVDDLWMKSIPRVFFGVHEYYIYPHSVIKILCNIRLYRLPYIRLLDFGILNYIIDKQDYISLIKTYMQQKKVTKAFIRFGHGHNPSFLVDSTCEDSFQINIDKYMSKTSNEQNLMIHPIKCERTYMKGVISLIYIDSKFSYAVIKIPKNINIGIRKYSIKKYTPNFALLRLGKIIISTLYETNKYPCVQLNFCHDHTHIYQYLLTKINYIDPNLYLEINKNYAKKMCKLITNRIKDFETLIKIKNQIDDSI